MQEIKKLRGSVLADKKLEEKKQENLNLTKEILVLKMKIDNLNTTISKLKNENKILKEEIERLKKNILELGVREKVVGVERQEEKLKLEEKVVESEGIVTKKENKPIIKNKFEKNIDKKENLGIIEKPHEDKKRRWKKRE